MGKFYLFFKGSGLPHKVVEDIKLQIQGDVRRFQEARGLALRLLSRREDSGLDSYYQEDDEQKGYFDEDYEDAWFDSYYGHGDSWSDAAWQEDGWYWVDEGDDYYDSDDYWNEPNAYQTEENKVQNQDSKESEMPSTTDAGPP